MKKKYFRNLWGYGLSLALSLSMITPCLAGDGTKSMAVTSTQGTLSTYEVEIPKSVEIPNGSNTANFDITVYGSITEDEKVAVVPDKSFTMVNDQTSEEVEGSVNLNDIYWYSNDLKVREQGVHTGSVLCDLGRGTWNGVVNFQISLVGKDECVSHVYGKNGVCIECGEEDPNATFVDIKQALSVSKNLFENSNMNKEFISGIVFLNKDDDITNRYNASDANVYDISLNNDGSVLAYVKNKVNTPQYYTIYIMPKNDGILRFYKNCVSMFDFSSYKNVNLDIYGLDNVSFSNVENASMMFSNCTIHGGIAHEKEQAWSVVEADEDYQSTLWLKKATNTYRMFYNVDGKSYVMNDADDTSAGTTIHNGYSLDVRGISSLGVDMFRYDASTVAITTLDVTIPDSISEIGSTCFKNVNHLYYNGTAEGSPWGAKAVN